MNLKTIHNDLKEIRYYYSKQKQFDSASRTVIASAVVDTVNKYNNAVKYAPARLFDLYISLYTQNNTQSTVAFDWDVSEDYIKQLNRKLCEYLLNYFTKTPV